MSTPERIAFAGTVAVDFDGVIHDYRDGYRDGSIYGAPLPGALEALHELRQTLAVYIHTSRPAGQVVQWLARHGAPVTDDDTCARPAPHTDHDCLQGRVRLWTDRTRILVTSRKLPAVVYVDDRAHRFTDWSRARAAVAAFASPRAQAGQHRRFTLERSHDPVGVSGTGTVAEGVQFSDGTVALRWMGTGRSTAVWDNLDAALSVHGHSGLTTVAWADPEPDH